MDGEDLLNQQVYLLNQQVLEIFQEILYRRSAVKLSPLKVRELGTFSDQLDDLISNNFEYVHSEIIWSLLVGCDLPMRLLEDE